MQTYSSPITDKKLIFAVSFCRARVEYTLYVSAISARSPPFLAAPLCAPEFPARQGRGDAPAAVAKCEKMSHNSAELSEVFSGNVDYLTRENAEHAAPA